MAVECLVLKTCKKNNEESLDSPLGGPFILEVYENRKREALPIKNGIRA